MFLTIQFHFLLVSRYLHLPNVKVTQWTISFTWLPNCLLTLHLPLIIHLLRWKSNANSAAYPLSTYYILMRLPPYHLLHTLHWLSTLIMFSFLQSSHLSLNVSETKYMKYILTLWLLPCDPYISIIVVLINHMSSCKYLGIILTSNLSWSSHILCICTCSKVRKHLGCIFHHFYHLF